MKTISAVTLAMMLVLSLCGSCFASDYSITPSPVEKYENKTIDEDDVEDITEHPLETEIYENSSPEYVPGRFLYIEKPAVSGRLFSCCQFAGEKRGQALLFLMT